MVNQLRKESNINPSNCHAQIRINAEKTAKRESGWVKIRLYFPVFPSVRDCSPYLVFSALIARSTCVYRIWKFEILLHTDVGTTETEW